MSEFRREQATLWDLEDTGELVTYQSVEVSTSEMSKPSAFIRFALILPMDFGNPVSWSIWSSSSSSYSSSLPHSEDERLILPGGLWSYCHHWTASIAGRKALIARRSLAMTHDAIATTWQNFAQKTKKGWLSKALINQEGSMQERKRQFQVVDIC